MISDLGTKLDWVGAVWLTALTFSWAIRWRSKIPGRFISVSGWLIILNGVLILRWPRIFGVITSVEIEYSTRFLIYLAASWLQWLDWAIYRELTQEEKTKILDAMSLLDHRKSKKERQALKKPKYVKREHYEAIVAQLAAIKKMEDEKKQDE